MGKDTTKNTMWGESVGNGPHGPCDTSTKRAATTCWGSGSQAQHVGGEVLGGRAITGSVMRVSSAHGPRAQRRYGRSGRSARRPCPSRVSLNKGFDYRMARQIVRPELYPVVATSQDPVCPDLPLWVASHEPSTTTPADAIPVGQSARSTHTTPHAGKWTRSGNRSGVGACSPHIRPENSTTLQTPTSAQHQADRPTLSRTVKRGTS